MALKFKFDDYQCSLREGSPPIASHERTDPTFLESLKVAHPPLAKLPVHEIASWIIARLNYLTAGALEVEGNDFGHDTNEFGYIIKLSDDADTTLVHGAVMIHADRVYFAANDIKIPDFQSIFVSLLAESPRDLAKCEIVVRVPESKKKRRYGWDGYSLLNR
jgi:hypothetical protein